MLQYLFAYVILCHFTFQPLCDAVVGKALTVKVKFQNPLSCVLKNVIFRFEGLGMRDIKTINYGYDNILTDWNNCVCKCVSNKWNNSCILILYPLSDIASQDKVSLTEKFVPLRCGPQKLLATLDCPQLTQVHGVANIVVKEQWKLSRSQETDYWLLLKWLCFITQSS